MQDLNALMGRSCDWVRVYLHNPNSGVKEEDRHFAGGLMIDGFWGKIEQIKETFRKSLKETIENTVRFHSILSLNDLWYLFNL
jgi:hypothetical protein